MVKYQVFTLYRERIGRMFGEEFLMNHDEKKTQIQTIGQKHLLFSRDVMKNFQWENIRRSEAHPYLDENNSTKGCVIHLKVESNKRRIIKLVDQE